MAIYQGKNMVSSNINQEEFDSIKTSILSKADKSTQYNITALASKWVDNRQIIDVAGLKMNDKGVIGLTDNTSYEQSIEAQFSYELPADGSITIIVNGEVPTVNIPIKILIVR